MDLFQHRYYRLNKTLMTFIGQWPYQRTRVRRGFLGVLIFLGASHIVPHMLAIVKYRDDWRIPLDSLLPTITDAAYATNMINFMWNSQKTLSLLNRIRTDWQLWARDREVNILHEYAEQGCNIIMVYTAMMYSAIIVLMTQSMIPKIIDVLLNNGTEPGKFPFPVVYYHVAMQRYYFYINIYYCITACTVFTINVTSATMLITYVQHACGTFAAVGYKLERIRNNDALVETGETPHELDERDMVHLASCIDRHNDAIEYANLIEASYTWTFFFHILFGMIVINIAGLQMFLRKSDLKSTTQFILFALATSLNFSIKCYISQILIDHSHSIHFYIHNTPWYRLSPKVQKLLHFMMMRCSVPCQLTAGPTFIMSMRTFGLTCKAFVSFFTFVRSMQDL